jgi:hypothetical protein
MAAPASVAETASIDTAIPLIDPPKGSIMKATVLIQAAAVAAFAFTAFAASAAPQEVQKLPRVVITGKSTQAVAQVQQLPRVVVTGYAVRDVAQVEQLPRVTVTARRA